MFLLASPCVHFARGHENIHGVKMMEILNGASFEIAIAMIFAWFLMIACWGDDPEVATRRIRAFRK